MDRLLPWLRRSGPAYAVVAALLVAVAWRVSGGGDSAGAQPVPDEAGEVALESAPTARAVVHVAGAVRRPGIYRMPAGARVNAAVSKAGGPTPRADLAAINLAATIQDGQQIVVPIRAPAGGPGAAQGASGPVSLSSATAEQLQTLDGVGPTLAARIIEWRRANGGFSSVDQLVEVPGIGEGRLANLRDRVAP